MADKNRSIFFTEEEKWRGKNNIFIQIDRRVIYVKLPAKSRAKQTALSLSVLFSSLMINMKVLFIIFIDVVHFSSGGPLSIRQARFEKT